MITRSLPHELFAFPFGGVTPGTTTCRRTTISARLFTSSTWGALMTQWRAEAQEALNTTVAASALARRDLYLVPSAPRCMAGPVRQA